MDALAPAQGSVAAEFEPLFAELEAERAVADAIREKSKELDRCYRALSSLLNGVHSSEASQFDVLVERTRPLFVQTRRHIAELAQLVPADQYYRVSPQPPPLFPGLQILILTVPPFCVGWEMVVV